ncbi:MAG: fatty acid desaturase [Planctomycetota bacterium]
MSISPQQLSRHHQASSARAALDLLFHWGGILGCAYAAHYFGTWPVYLAALVLIAGFQNSLVSLAHEAWHNKTLRPTGLNHAVGAWLYAYPVGLTYYNDMYRHIAHHEFVGKPNDPDWENYSNAHFETKSKTLRFLFGKLIGMHLVTTLVHYLVRGKPKIVVDTSTKKRSVPIKRELLCVGIVQLILLGGFTLFGHFWEYLVLWMLPLSTFTSFFIATRALLEHAHAQAPPDPDERLFDFAPGPIGHFFFSPCHFHLHALHHKYPSAPHYRLPKLKRELADENGLGYPGSQRGGYIQALGEYVGQLSQTTK